MSGGKLLDKIEIELRAQSGQTIVVYIDIFDNSLSRKWLMSLDQLIRDNYHLEKNYCFLGFPDSDRDGHYILDQVNSSIDAINQSDIGYQIQERFEFNDCITDEPVGNRTHGRNIIQEKFNRLHRYFEDLQGVSGKISPYFLKSPADVRWHIRQLNLLCHEFESWALSYRKQVEAPEWVRPSQLMCWLNAPRFVLDEEDYELFGIETINRPLGGVFVGVNKAVGKHHWEVFLDEGRDSRIDELTTSTLKSQTEASGDFDIEWANNPGNFVWQQIKLKEFREWLLVNNFDPDEKSLTIGHPMIGQVDLEKSFGLVDYQVIWRILYNHLDVFKIKTSNHAVTYDYRWSDSDYKDLQIKIIEGRQK